VCSVVDVNADEWSEFIEGLPTSAGVEADTDSECSLYELSLMSQVVYALHGNEKIADSTSSNTVTNLKALTDKGWIVAEEHRQSTFEMTADTLLGYAVFTFTQGQKRLAVLSYKGTSTTSTSDIQLDVMNVALGFYPTSNLKKAAEIVKKYQKDYKVMVTGHSLGGYFAEVVGTRFQIAGVGFCAPGSHSKIPVMGDHGGKKHDGFRNINFANDVLGNMNAATWEHPQWSIYVEDYDGFHTHAPTKMVEAMKCREGWTNLNAKANSKWIEGTLGSGYYTKYTLDDCKNQYPKSVVSSAVAPSVLGAQLVLTTVLVLL